MASKSGGPTGPKKIKSGFCFLEVLGHDRHQLAKRCKDAGHNAKIPVTIRGFLHYPTSRDDGTSIEFCVEVESVVERAR
jgi:hypothetical protein